MNPKVDTFWGIAGLRPLTAVLRWELRLFPTACKQNTLIVFKDNRPDGFSLDYQLMDRYLGRTTTTVADVTPE